MLKKILVSTTAALALIATPALAQATLADRAASPMAEGEELAGSALLIGIFAVASVVAGAIILIDRSDDEPASP